MSKKKKEELADTKLLMENDLSFIEKKSTRTALAKEYLQDIEETLFLLSKQCGYETVVVSTPIVDRDINSAYFAGPRSTMAAQLLVREQFGREIYHKVKSPWEFEKLPTEDIFRIYKDCFHSLVKESKSSI